MPRRIRVEGQLSTEELQQRYRSATQASEKMHWQVPQHLQVLTVFKRIRYNAWPQSRRDFVLFQTVNSIHRTRRRWIRSKLPYRDYLYLAEERTNVFPSGSLKRAEVPQCSTFGSCTNSTPRADSSS
jgi:hypothetical protein